MRIAAWLALIALLLLGRVLHNDNIAASAEPVALGLLWLVAPRGMRAGIACVLALSLVILMAAGRDWMLQLAPALVAAFVGWLFARSLLRGRTPLIARAVAAIDGAAQLGDPAIARYARNLTSLWAAFQGALAMLGVLCAINAHATASPITLPSPALFAMLLPCASATLFLSEFALRAWLVPQAPRHRLRDFLRDMLRVWPELIDE